MLLHVPDANDIRYFIYLSDAKISMLSDQMELPDATQRRSGRDLGPKPAVFRSEVLESRETKTAVKLRRILDALRGSGKIGAVDEPGEYFEGALPARWGLYNDWGRPLGEPPLVYFGGETEETLFGLGGSARHVIGMSGAASTGSRSATPYLVKRILEGLGTDESGWRAHDSPQDVFQGIAIANHYLEATPPQNLGFVARTLLVGVARPFLGDGPYKKCILGTPLYVEMLDTREIQQY